MARHETLAAVDLGSNSFHLQIGRVEGGQIYPLDSLREVVRLGAGLTAEKRIDRATQARALDALPAAAAALWGVKRSECRAEHGAVLHEASGRKAPDSALAASAAQRSARRVQLKRRGEFRLDLLRRAPA